MTQQEHDEIEQQLIQNYQEAANELVKLSADDIPEIQLKAVIKNDFDMMYITDLISCA